MWWQFPSFYKQMELGLSVTSQLQRYNSVDFAHNIHLLGLHFFCLFVYEGWNFNSGKYLFTTDTK